MKFKSSMQKALFFMSTASFAVMAACFFLRDIDFFESLGITALTVFTHAMLRYIGAVIVALMPKSFTDPSRRCYQPKKWEPALYKKLGFKKLKNRAPTYDPDEFDITKRTPPELLQNSCRAEAIHKIIALMSFLPVLYSLRFGALPVFLITSVAGAGLDLYFVAVQRYNRPRLIKYAESFNNKSKEKNICKK